MESKRISNDFFGFFDSMNESCDGFEKWSHTWNPQKMVDIKNVNTPHTADIKTMGHKIICRFEQNVNSGRFWGHPPTPQSAEVDLVICSPIALNYSI